MEPPKAVNAWGGAGEHRTSGQLALGDAELDKLWGAITNLQDMALLRLAVATGMRRDDIIQVEIKDVDLAHGTVKYYERKKKRVWSGLFGPPTLQALATHINNLPRGTPWLFPSPKLGPRKHISSRHAYNVLQRWLKAAELPPRPFHALRATCIKALQRRGLSIELVMRQTGDTFRTIKEHYDTPSDTELEAAFRDRGL